MKPRPVTSSLNRRRSLDGTTPISIAKRDYKLLLSSAETMKKVDDKLYKLTETSHIEPFQILSTEISRQLTSLKNSNNSIHISKHKMSYQVRHLSVEISEVCKAKKSVHKSISSISARIEKLCNNIKSIQGSQQLALEDQEVYLHIRERMLETRIFLDMNKHALNEDLKQKTLLLVDTQRIQAETNENKTKNYRQFKELHKSLDFFQYRTDKVSQKLQKDQDLMELIDLGREARFLRQQDIVEKVGISEQDLREKQIRESLMLHKLWYSKLTMQLRAYTDKFSKVDLAFKKIRSVTSLESISSIVEKFLTKEENLSELTNLIRKNKVQIDSFAQRNIDIQERIKCIEVYDKNSISGSMIKQLNSQIMFLTGRNALVRSKHLEIVSVVKTIKNWTERMIKFFDPSCEVYCQSIGEGLKLLREKIRANIRPVSKFSTQESSFFVTNFNGSMGKSQKKFVEEVVELSELNHFESEDSRDSWRSVEKKLRKSSINKKY